ncbi:MAG: NPXTG-anchored protein, partial [Oscillospiraceae bacterium]|nr:NPXTG-anchored protein [Oscillospiraceae bacterium]
DIIKKAIEAEEVPVIVVANLGGTVISAELLLEIKELGVDVKIELENGFSFLIKADTISDEVTNFDLNIDVDFTDEETTIGNAVIPTGSIVITPSFKGDFGFEIEMTLTAEQLEEAGIDVENVKLWYISGTTVTELDVIVVNDDGSITISFSSASFYVLSAEAPEMLELVVSTPVATPDVGDISIVPGTDTVVNVPVNDGVTIGGDGAAEAPARGGDGNPGTGVAGIGLAAMFLSAGAAIIARRKK